MKIEKVLTARCMSGFYNRDLQAMKAGATPDGFVFKGTPITPGFNAIVQPGEAISVILILSDGQVAFGDCISVNLAGAAGRDPLFKADEQQRIIETTIADFLQRKSIDQFKELAECVDSMELHGKKLHMAVRYGVTQAILDATAKANHLTMAEIIRNEYGCTIADKLIPLAAAALNEQKENIDKMILKKVPYMPHGSSNNVERDFGTKGEKLLDYIYWLIQRINAIRDSDYHPTIHLDVYGILGEAFNLDIQKINDFIGKMRDACLPFPLMVETPIIADNGNNQINLYRELVEELKNKSINVKIIVDEWCNTLEDVQAFANEGAADIIKVKTPDLGGINNSIEAILICKKKGIGSFVAGSSSATDQSARINCHIALATQADILSENPGQGVDEGLMIEYNEMQRALTLIQNRKKERSS